MKTPSLSKIVVVAWRALLRHRLHWIEKMDWMLSWWKNRRIILAFRPWEKCSSRSQISRKIRRLSWQLITTWLPADWIWIMFSGSPKIELKALMVLSLMWLSSSFEQMTTLSCSCCYQKKWSWLKVRQSFSFFPCSTSKSQITPSRKMVFLWFPAMAFLISVILKLQKQRIRELLLLQIMTR